MGRLTGDDGFFAGWRGLRNFWALVIVSSGALAGLVQSLGPVQPLPQARPVASGHPAGAPTQAQASQEAAVHAPSPAATPPVQPAGARPGRDQAGPITDPDPALLEPAENTKGMLPRIADDGRRPMQVYAAGFDQSNRQPRIALLVAGFGLSEADSLRAARLLPGNVSFAVSPYSDTVVPALAAARSAQHEYLLSVPMEPQGYPLNDPGNQGLMTNLGRAENMKRLLWAMSRFGGYVGVTSALGDLRGERFAGLSDQMEPVLRQVARRGLLYVDPRPGQAPPPQTWSRVPDLVLDDPATADAIDGRLAELEAVARERGSAMGLAGAPRPVTVDRITAWAEALAGKGIVLAPVSAVVRPPQRESATPKQASAAADPGRDSPDAGAEVRSPRAQSASKDSGE